MKSRKIIGGFSWRKAIEELLRKCIILNVNVSNLSRKPIKNNSNMNGGVNFDLRRYYFRSYFEDIKTKLREIHDKLYLLLKNLDKKTPDITRHDYCYTAKGKTICLTFNIEEGDGVFKDVKSLKKTYDKYNTIYSIILEIIEEHKVSGARSSPVSEVSYSPVDVSDSGDTEVNDASNDSGVTEVNDASNNLFGFTEDKCANIYKSLLVFTDLLDENKFKKFDMLYHFDNILKFFGRYYIKSPEKKKSKVSNFSEDWDLGSDEESKHKESEEFFDINNENALWTTNYKDEEGNAIKLKNFFNLFCTEISHITNLNPESSKEIIDEFIKLITYQNEYLGNLLFIQFNRYLGDLTLQYVEVRNRGGKTKRRKRTKKRK